MTLRRNTAAQETGHCHIFLAYWLKMNKLETCISKGPGPCLGCIIDAHCTFESQISAHVLRALSPVECIFLIVNVIWGGFSQNQGEERYILLFQVRGKIVLNSVNKSKGNKLIPFFLDNDCRISINNPRFRSYFTGCL